MVQPRFPLLLRGGEGSEGAHPAVVQHAEGGAVQVSRGGELGVQVEQGGREVSGGEGTGHGALALVHGGEGVGGGGEGQVQVLLQGHGHSEGSGRLAGDGGVAAGLCGGGEHHESGGGQGGGQVGGDVHLEGPVEVHSPPC